MNGWVSVNVGLPGDNIVVWGYYTTRRGNKKVDEVYLDRGDWYTNSINNVCVNVLAWQEITPPEPPEE